MQRRKRQQDVWVVRILVWHHARVLAVTVVKTHANMNVKEDVKVLAVTPVNTLVIKAPYKDPY